MACASGEEIADITNVDKATVTRETETLLQIGSLSNLQQSLVNFTDSDFAPQVTKETVSKELETLSDLGQCPISDKVLANFEETKTLPDKSIERRVTQSRLYSKSK